MLAGMVVQEFIISADKKRAGTTGGVKNLTVMGDQHTVVVNNISFDIRAGEILGFAGVQGIIDVVR